MCQDIFFRLHEAALKIKPLILGTFILACSFPIAGWADDQASSSSEAANTSATTPMPNCNLPLLPAIENLGIDFSGYVEGSYNYLSGNGFFTSGAPDRIFDTETNGFTLQQAGITFAKQPDQGLGGLLYIIAGNDANITAAYPASRTNYVDVVQAFLQYAVDDFTVMGGKFVSLAGVEYIDPTLNTNFSQSILAGYSQPGTLTGLRTTYVINKILTLNLGVNNGWDSIPNNSGGDPTLEAGAQWDPDQYFQFIVDDYYGQQRVFGAVNEGPVGSRNLLDLVGTINATEKLSFVTNFDYGQQCNAIFADGNTGTAEWNGIAGYINYKFTDKWFASLRGEYFDDAEGYRTGVVQDWREATLSVGYKPNKYLEFMAETRKDWSNVNAFLDLNGVTASTNQESVALAGMVMF